MLFSAHAEVFPPANAEKAVGTTLLRACGGISVFCAGCASAAGSSPRMRRYFLVVSGNDFATLLFSAHAEVFPAHAHRQPARQSLLRACGGISCCAGSRWGGVFLFSAHAEVFPPIRSVRALRWTLLRACGGISGNFEPICQLPPSSPRMRRYFRPSRALPFFQSLFSAHAEVFPNCAAEEPE